MKMQALTRVPQRISFLLDIVLVIYSRDSQLVSANQKRRTIEPL